MALNRAGVLLANEFNSRHVFLKYWQISDVSALQLRVVNARSLWVLVSASNHAMGNLYRCGGMPLQYKHLKIQNLAIICAEAAHLSEGGSVRSHSS